MHILDLLNHQNLGLSEWLPILKACESHAKKHKGKVNTYNCLKDFDSDYNFVWYSDFPSLGKTKITMEGA